MNQALTRGDHLTGSTTLNAGFKGWRSPFRHNGETFAAMELTICAQSASTSALVRIFDSGRTTEYARGTAAIGTGLTNITVALDKAVSDVAPGTILYVSYEPETAGVLGYPAGGSYAANDADPNVNREYYQDATNAWVAATPIGNYRIPFRLLRSGVGFTMPADIKALVGAETCLQHDGICSAHSSSGLVGYSVSIVGPKGKNEERVFRFTPASGDVGVQSFTAKLFDANGDRVTSRGFTLSVVSNTPKTTARNVLLAGDSLIAIGTIPATAQANLAALGGTVPTFVGSQKINAVSAGSVANLTEWDVYSSGGVDYTLGMIDAVNLRLGFFNGAHALPSSGTLTKVGAFSGSAPATIAFSGTVTTPHEGHGGYVFASFASAGSPYCNPLTGLLDLDWYRTTYGIVGHIDYVDHDLGINCSFTETLRTAADIAGNIADAKTVANLFLADNANCIVVFSLPSIGGNTSDGFANINNADISRETFEANLFNLRWAMLEAFDNGAYHANVKIGASGLAIDRYYGYERRASAVAARIPTAVDKHINPVHPCTVGYQQKADQKTAELMAWLP